MSAMTPIPMTVRRTTHDDVATVNAWLTARGERAWSADLLTLAPGFIIDGLAAVWLFASPPFAYIEALVANPGAADADRDGALDAVVFAALAHARERGVRAVFSTTDVPAVVTRASRHGFEVIRRAATLIVADLGASAVAFDDGGQR